MNVAGIDFARVRAVTFDVGGTLLAPHPGVGEVYREILAKYDIVIAPDVLNLRFREVFKKQCALRPRLQVNEATEIVFWREIVRHCVSPECPSALVEQVFQQLWMEFASAKRWRARPGAAETIQALAHRRQPQLAVLSNWDARLRHVLSELGWIQHFTKIFISSELGVEKPDVRVFRVVEKALGIPCDACLHVGDSYAQDYQGARQAGWQAMLLSPAAADPAAPYLDQLDSLPALLA